MRRTAINLAVIDPLTGSAVGGAVVEIIDRATGNPATVYAAEAGTTEATNPMTTDTWGRLDGWLDRGEYRADVSGTGIASYSVYFDSAPGGDGAVDTGWLADGAVTPDKMTPDWDTGRPAGSVAFPGTGTALMDFRDQGGADPLKIQPDATYLVFVTLEIEWTSNNVGYLYAEIVVNGVTQNLTRINIRNMAPNGQRQHYPIISPVSVTGPADQVIDVKLGVGSGAPLGTVQQSGSKLSYMRMS